MGAQDYLLASSVLGVLAQRLVRVVCTHCRAEQFLEPEFLREIGFPPQAGVVASHGMGCKECDHTGYQGRIGIFELMLMREPIRRLTITNADSTRLRKTALEGGMVALRQDGFGKVKAGMTSVAEVLRVTQDQ